MKSIKSIVCYPNLLAFEPTEQNVETFMGVLVDAGVTHVQVKSHRDDPCRSFDGPKSRTNTA